MRRLAGLALICVSLLASLLLGRVGDERNVRALALHLGCSPETARRLYRLARQHGYGAAYMRVFPGGAIPGIRPF